ncbi:trehalase-like domain-containing protein [Rhizobium brockwellii]
MTALKEMWAQHRRRTIQTQLVGPVGSRDLIRHCRFEPKRQVREVGSSPRTFHPKLSQEERSMDASGDLIENIVAAEHSQLDAAVVPRTIENHGVIGDLATIALVATDGAIDVLCWPDFDSPTIFAALLDPERGGMFQLAPELADARVTQQYLPDTKVLLTR